MAENRLLNIGTGIAIDPAALLGESVAVLGIKGSGKSNTAAVLAEEMLACGVPICIVDIAGEYWGLKEQYKILVAGKSAHVDIAAQPTQAATLAEFSLRNNVSIILDVSDFRAEDRMTFLLNYFETIWALAGELRRPYQIFLEEAHNFIPQRTSTPVTDVLVTIATEGRKRGLGIVMIGQRSARIDKDVLTQAGILFLHHVRHPSDTSVYQDIIPAERSWTKTITNELATGQAIVMIGASITVSNIRQRHTFHAGYTPGMDDVQAPELHTLDDKTLASLRDLLSTKPVAPTEEPAVVDSEKAQLQQQIAELQEQMDVLQNELDDALAVAERLKAENELLSKIRIVIDPVPVSLSIAGYGVDAQPQPVHGNIVKADDAAIRRERERFETFLSDLAALPAMERAVALYFVQRPDMTTTFKRLEKHVQYTYSSMKKNPPLRSIELGVLQRESTKDGYIYRSVLDATLQAKFGALPPDELRQRVIGALS
jgi:hypothetical protein